MPKVSVIIPVYNTDKYLSECLDSVINQTLRDIEIICIDDGSTDKSLEILNDYAAKDDRIKILTQEHKYAGVARNYGISIAKGEYIFFVDSDDYCKLSTLKSLYNKAEETFSDIVIARPFAYIEKTKKINKIKFSLETSYLNGKNVFSYKDCYRYFFQVFEAWPWDKLYKLDFIIKNNVKFESFRSCEDVTFTFLACIFAKKITFIDNYLFYHRLHDKSMDNNRELYSFFYAYFNIKDKLCLYGLYDTLKESLINDLCETTYNHYFHFNSLYKKICCFYFIKNRLYPKFDLGSFNEIHFENKKFFLFLKSIKNNSFIKHYFLTEILYKIRQFILSIKLIWSCVCI